MTLRETNLLRLAKSDFDVVVVGGGINGAVAAAAMSARGARVALIDRGDFAGLTSQESSNLAWGGIKYLETYEFGLVRKLCRSRNRLIRAYPSTVEEIRFFVTHERGFRHGRWKLWLGAWLYWLMGNLFTRRPRVLSRRDIARDEPIVALERCDGGFEYSDAYLHDNDARFVWNFVRRALDYGCAAANYVESLGAERTDDGWTVHARDVMDGRTFDIRAKVLVNACGPYVDTHNTLTGDATGTHHVFSKGIHLIVDRLTPHRRVLTFFADDGRLFFVVPMGPRTCIGTTDTRVDRPETFVTDDDRRFVLDNINKRLALPRPLTPADIIAERCGVRPLAVTGDSGPHDWLQLSRRHVLEVNTSRQHVSVFGGKLTDCINVGNELCAIVARLGVPIPQHRRRWYGAPSRSLREEFFLQSDRMGLDAMTSPRSSEKLSTRLWRRYAQDAFTLLDAIRSDPRMADVLIDNAEYIRGEIELAAKREMITRLDDFLRRRSKISMVVRRDLLDQSPGLDEACRILFGPAACARLDEYLAASLTQHPPSSRTLSPA